METDFNPIRFSFTGDLGHDQNLILKGPQRLKEADVLIMESTYGNRCHDRTDKLDDIARICNEVFSRQGVLVIPAFAVGRSQEIIYCLGKLERQGRIPKVPIILDSPMSAAALAIFINHAEDQIIESSFREHPHEFLPENFEISESPDDSMLACMRDGPMVVISASGMLSGGRILHHLKNRLPDERNGVLFIGFQAEGTKGRYLLDNGEKEKEMRIHHHPVPINAKIYNLDAFSAHSDYKEILNWLETIENKPKEVIINHGAPNSQEALAQKITDRFGWKATPAYLKKEYSFGDKKK